MQVPQGRRAAGTALTRRRVGAVQGSCPRPRSEAHLGPTVGACVQPTRSGDNHAPLEHHPRPCHTAASRCPPPGHAPPPLPAGRGPAGCCPSVLPPAEGEQHCWAPATPSSKLCAGQALPGLPPRVPRPPPPRLAAPCCSSTSHPPALRLRPPSPRHLRMHVRLHTTLLWTATRVHAVMAPSSATAAPRSPAWARLAWSLSMSS